MPERAPHSEVGAGTEPRKGATSWLPFAAAFAFATASTLVAAFSRGAMYDRDPKYKAPYADVGFMLTPDWGSRRAQIAVQTFSVCYGLLAIGFILTHPMRWVALRRALYVLGLSQFVAIGVQAATLMPDPNPAWRWGYAMYPAGLVTAWGYVHLYLRASPPPAENDGDGDDDTGGDAPLCDRESVMRWTIGVLCLFGLFLTLASRAMYSVDLLSVLAIVAITFLWWEWAARSEAAVRNLGPAAVWFEQDAFANRSDVHEPVMPDPGQVPFVPVLLHDRAADDTSAVARGEAPSAAEEDEMKLVIHVHRHMAEWGKVFYPVAGSLGGFVLGGSAGMLDFVSAAVTDGFRPLDRPPMRDLLFETFDQLNLHVPARTADIMAFVAAAVTFLDIFLLQPFPLTSLRRLSVVWGTCFFLRFFFVSSTFVMDPYSECRHRLHPDTGTCGDCIFSGHTCTFLASAWTICSFRPSRGLRITAGAFVSLMLLLVIMTRLHYTRDVAMAVFVMGAVQRFWTAFVFERPDRAARSELVFSFEADYYVARERVLFGYPRRDRGASGSSPGGEPVEMQPANGEASGFAPAGSMRVEGVEDDGARSLCEALHWRRVFRLVRPTGLQSPAVRAVLRAPLTEPSAQQHTGY